MTTSRHPRLQTHPRTPGCGRLGPRISRILGPAPFDGGTASVGNGTHVGFFAADQAAVDAFHRAAIAAGAVDEGTPGPRPEYGEPYYGCFVRDLDGHKIEAAYWNAALMEQLYGSGE